jgi:hypothetical protein
MQDDDKIEYLPGSYWMDVPDATQPSGWKRRQFFVVKNPSRLFTSSANVLDQPENIDTLTCNTGK